MKVTCSKTVSNLKYYAKIKYKCEICFVNVTVCQGNDRFFQINERLDELLRILPFNKCHSRPLFISELLEVV